MSFALEPSDYLGFLIEAHEEFQRDSLSMRKAITCCLFANHLPEHLVAKYGQTAAGKLRGAQTVADYRAVLCQAEPTLGVVRGLCDFAKHGPALKRASVTVSRTKQGTTLELDYGAFMMGVPNHAPTDKLIVTLSDGSDGWLEAHLLKTVRFWRDEFTSQQL